MSSFKITPLVFLIAVTFAVAQTAPTNAPEKPERPRTADGKWFINDMNRPWPTRVEPKPESELAASAKPPADAIILFDGSDLSHWQPSDWKLKDGFMESIPKGHSIKTRDGFGSCRLHVEWWTPAPPQGAGQMQGNSGVYLMSKYEVQVLDNTNNKTYADGIAGAIYGQSPPLAEASRSSGQWNSYDIEFHRPKFNPSFLTQPPMRAADGTALYPANITVYFNGILVQDHYTLLGKTGGSKPVYETHADKMPLLLQGHDSIVRYRNIWLVPITD